MAFNKWSLDTNSKSVATQIAEQNQNWQKMDNIEKSFGDYNFNGFNIPPSSSTKVLYPNKKHAGILITRLNGFANEGGLYLITGYFNGDLRRNSVNTINNDSQVSIENQEDGFVVSNNNGGTITLDCYLISFANQYTVQS